MLYIKLPLIIREAKKTYIILWPLDSVRVSQARMRLQPGSLLPAALGSSGGVIDMTLLAWSVGLNSYYRENIFLMFVFAVDPGKFFATVIARWLTSRLRGMYLPMQATLCSASAMNAVLMLTRFSLAFFLWFLWQSVRPSLCEKSHIYQHIVKCYRSSCATIAGSHAAVATICSDLGDIDFIWKISIDASRLWLMIF